MYRFDLPRSPEWASRKALILLEAGHNSPEAETLDLAGIGNGQDVLA